MSAAPKRSTAKTLSLVTIIGLLALVVVMDISRRKAENEVASLTMRLDQVTGGSNEQSKAEADRIIAEVRKLFVLESETPTVATIVNVDQLKSQNSFYETAENGDFVLIDANEKTATAKAILYDDDKNIIKNVVPVQFTPDAPAADGTTPTDGTAPAADGAVSSPAAPKVEANQ